MADGYSIEDPHQLLTHQQWQGMTAIAFFGFLSLFSTFTLAIFLGRRIILRRRDGRRQSPLLILVFNLMIADFLLGLAFMLDVHWLVLGQIAPDTTACWVQGWFKSIGNLGAGYFCLAIGIYTFAFIVFRYQIPPVGVYSMIAFFWTLDFSYAIAGVSLHPTDWFGSFGNWCWINAKYSALQNGMYITSIATVDVASIVIYTALFIVLRLRIRRKYYDPIRCAKALTVSKLMFIFPGAYVACTAPLVITPAMYATGVPITNTHKLAGGCLVASIGWIDAIIYTLTRRFETDDDRLTDSASDLDPLDILDSWWSYKADYGTTTTCEAVPNMSRTRSTEDLFGGPTPKDGVHTYTTVKVTSAPADLEAIGCSEEDFLKSRRRDSDKSINIEIREK